MENFEINFKQIDRMKKITLEEKNFRIQNLEFLFLYNFLYKQEVTPNFPNLLKFLYENQFILLLPMKLIILHFQK